MNECTNSWMDSKMYRYAYVSKHRKEKKDIDPDILIDWNIFIALKTD